MKITTGHSFKKNPIWIRSFEIIPSIAYYTDKYYSFNSIRISWLGFDFNLSKN